MRICCYPGTFDPFTLGHLDILRRSAAIFDRVIVGILVNINKKPVFSIEERVGFIQAAAKEAGIANFQVESFGGLLVDFCKERGADVIVRGLRAVSDYEYELQIAATNHVLAPDIQTIFMVTDAKYSYLSSSTLREVGRFGGDISAMVPPANLKYIQERLHKNEF